MYKLNHLVIVDSSVLEVVKIGYCNVERESNEAALMRHNFDPSDRSKKVADMVIVETDLMAQDRRSSAFAILQHSALYNGMLLEWTYTAVKSPTGTNYQNELKPFDRTRLVIEIKTLNRYIHGSKGCGCL